MRELPKIKIVERVTNKSYKLSDFIGKDNEYIKNSVYGHIFIDNIDVLKNNFDLLIHILKLVNKDIICNDYESVLFLEKNLDNNIKTKLLDDGLNKDRSYINLDELEKVNLFIPLIYSLWNIKTGKDISVVNYKNDTSNNMYNDNGNRRIKLDDLKRIKELIYKLDELIKNPNDIGKCILISNYIQENIQYVEGIESRAKDGIYNINTNEKNLCEKASLIETVINEHYGLCVGIANTTSLLLNNPIFNVDIRTIAGCNHGWNVVNIDGKSYYIDNTWSVTRNKDRLDYALKAKSFTDEYLFFGKRKALEISHHIPESSLLNYNLENDNLDRSIIQNNKNELGKVLNYKYEHKLVFQSKKI